GAAAAGAGEADGGEEGAGRVELEHSALPVGRVDLAGGVDGEPAVVGGGAAGAGRQGDGAERAAAGRVEHPHLAAGGEGVELAVAAGVEVDRVEPGGEPAGGVVGGVAPDDAA